MNARTFRDALHGVIAFPVTPFDATGAVDLHELQRLVGRMTAQPMAAIVAAGGTGELYSLTPDEHTAVVSCVVQQIGGARPVIAGVGGSLGTACDLARRAAAQGADAILALPPWYPAAETDGLVAYYQAIGAGSPLPLIVYSRDWVNPTPAVVERLAEAVPTLAVWKDGQGDMRRYQQIIARVGDRLHWVGGAGDDLVGAYYQLGIRTYTSSISNVSPALAVKLHEVAAAGDAEALRALLHTYVVPLYAFRSRRKGYEVSAMKAMLTLLGHAGGSVRAPLVDVTPGEMQALQAILDTWRPYL